MSLNPQQARAEAESILRATTALARRFELIHANIRDNRFGTTGQDLGHAIEEAGAIIDRATSLQTLLSGAEAQS